MDNSTYVALSLAQAMRRDMDVTANNIANANTSGFKTERIVFDSVLFKDAGLDVRDTTNFVLDRGSYLDESQGAITNTGNPLDFALEGDGWFAYETQDGRTAYGRDGRFTLDAQGNLVTLSGAQVLDVGGGNIAIPPDAGQLVVSRDGSISTLAGDALGQLGVFNLPDLQAYERIGNNMLAAPEGEAGAGLMPAELDETTQIVQGSIENSNVQPVVEMTRMIQVQQAYDRAIKLMNTEDDLRKDMLQRLGRIT
ncbi:flagellar basal-body rod protein FlgF [Maritimibacter alkaliphilus]|uniref:flagellar basal-body rod protein FlgF n=1 Tax=Maritimibacter alkaliphilus TaxID=404236 RepID=UPI001C980A34|nr:flagellar basal-body rod protein FlgF [Maritimibacter alkaliphilus]MBY6093044.1 flagellar basal-body rod protein FlgF [Maritimibacter alkaliphilus]